MNRGAWLIALQLLVACAGKGPASPADPGSPGSAAAAAEAAKPERWAASIVLPTEIRDFVVSFARRGDAWTASAEVLGKSFDLSAVTFTPERIGFTLLDREVYALARDGSRAHGTGKIAGAELVIKMEQLAHGEAPRSAFNRPQTPKPPFPYESREIAIDAPDGGKLAATITVPNGTGPFPAVLLLSGSGQQDRDETIFHHKPYLLLSDRLTRAGFVTVRFDDRGTGKTVGAVGTLDTEIADASAGIERMKSQKEIDPRRIGIVAHSTGGMVAPFVAVKTRSVAFIVSLAGVAVSGRELVPLQLEIEARLQGVPDDAIKATVEMQRKVGEAASKDPAAVRAVLTDLVKPQLAQALGRAPTQDEIDRAIARPLAEATAPWVASFFRLDPRTAWKQLELPVLLVVGDKDTQVPADATIKALEDALSPKARRLATMKKLPGLNHLFQHTSGPGRTSEYALIDETFDPATAELVTSWLVERARTSPM